MGHNSNTFRLEKKLHGKMRVWNVQVVEAQVCDVNMLVYGRQLSVKAPASTKLHTRLLQGRTGNPAM